MSPATRPSAIAHLLQDRAVRLAAGLALIVAIPVAVLFYFQLRSIRDLEQTSTTVLRQLSRDTADALTRAVEDMLKRPHIGVLLRTTQARSEPLDLAWIDPVFEQGLKESPFVDELWVWSEVSDTDNANTWFVFDHASLDAPAADPGRRFKASPERHAQFMDQIRQFATERKAIVAFPATIDGRRKYVQVQLRFTLPARGRFTSFVGFAVDAERLTTTHLPALITQRLGSTPQPTGFPRLQARLFDGSGAAVASMNPPGQGSIDERAFPLVFFDRELLEFAAPYEQQRETWRLQTTFGAQTMADIVGATTRPQLALMLVLALVMAGGVFFVARAAAREVRLAELKSNFVASVSHDLKTPLALIQLFAETLELGRVRTTDRAQEYYRIINSEARKLTRLIENILDFSKMEAGLRPYRMAPVDLGALTQRVVEKMGSQFAQARFQVSVTADPHLPRVMADENATEQALENLLGNAVKYSGDSREVGVQVRREPEGVAVTVTDRGLGIAKREQKRIFRKFYRVASDLGGGPQGCGLGLAIVDHTMRGHGGYVQVESEPNRGSAFTLHFPAAPASVPDGERDEANPGDRGRAADAARPA